MTDHNNLLDIEAFGALIEARLHTLTTVSLVQRSGLTLTLRVGAREVAIKLDNLYKSYLQDPDALNSLLRAFTQALDKAEHEREISSYADLRTRIFPMLKPIALLMTVRERNWPMLAYRPFLADLIISYVIDGPGSLAYITEPHLEHWQISEHEIHEQAIENLRQRTDERGNYTATGEGAQRLIVYNTQDGYDATRLLLPGMLIRWRPQFPGNMVIGVPNRDFLIAFSDADRTILSSVAQQIQVDAAQREHGLSDQLFTLENGSIREYEWE